MSSRVISLLSAAFVATGAFLGTSSAVAGHDVWPTINGVLWINQYDQNATNYGTARNDELLGGHGDDNIYGRGGADVIWGDYKATNNNTWQRDRVYAGGGADWIYGSHGGNVIYAGGGNDMVRVWFGRGFVDCGAGRDILYVSRKSHPHVKIRHCERVSHKSARQVGDT
jgi:Ca2+-binding RTX toxin-like protein